MKRERIVAYLRHRMAEFGIEPEDLAPEPATIAQVKAPGPDRYCSANGERWDGEGEMPDWLRRAIGAGQSIEHFEATGARPAHTRRQAASPRIVDQDGDYSRKPFRK